MSLDLRGLSVDIAGRRIVSGITLRVADGQFAGLIGPNGSGKSTILKAIYRVHPLAAGCVLVNGTDLHRMRPRLAARRVAVVAQENLMDFGFTVREMVMIGRTPHKGPFDRDDEDDQAIVQDAMERTGCADLGGRSFQSLSGGEKQRVLIARALAQGADHLILDEPTNHLDIDSRRALLDALNDYDGAVILITHDRSLIDLVADRLWLTADGTIKPFKGDMDDYARFVLDRVKADTVAPGQKTVSDAVLSAQQAAANEARYAAKKAAKKRRRRGY